MARNEHFHEADKLSLPVPAGVKSGDPVLIGDLPGMAVTDRRPDGEATVWFLGSWTVPVTGAVAKVGLPVYITSTRTLTMTASGNRRWGYTLGTKGAGTADLRVLLSQLGAPAAAA